jgi:hypothetical protein
LSWLGTDVQLRPIGDDTAIIEKGQNKLSLRLFKSEKKAILTFKSKILIEYTIIPEIDNYIINLEEQQQRMKNLIRTQLKEYQIFSYYDMETAMVLPLISQGRYKDTDKEYWSRIEPDLMELMSDKSFYALVDRVKDNLGTYCNNILRAVKNIKK